MERKFKKTPPRLNQVFDRYRDPVYFVTICTLLRRELLANAIVHDAFRDYAITGQQYGVSVGRYGVMPDHIHVFVAPGENVTLSRWVKGLKRHLDKVLLTSGHEPTRLEHSALTSFWQPGSFDHLLRSSESYETKWEYVWRNPTDADLAPMPEDWPYQGEIVVFDRV